MNNAKPSNPLIQNFRGVFLPAHEKHLPEWMNTKNQLVDGKPTYQLDKIRAVLALVPADRRRVAIDIGAHCGLWSVHLAKEFEFVEAFEPLALHRECFNLNLDPRNNYRLHECALGAEVGTVNIYTAPTSSGDSYVDGAGDIPLRVLDHLNLSNVDLIKLDCEGFELFALRGAVDTLFRCQPVIIVEQKPGKAQKFGLKETEAVTFLQDMGYKMAREMSGDFIMVPTPGLAIKAERYFTALERVNAAESVSGYLKTSDGAIAGVTAAEAAETETHSADADPVETGAADAVESASSEGGEAKSVELAGNPGQES